MKTGEWGVTVDCICGEGGEKLEYIPDGGELRPW